MCTDEVFLRRAYLDVIGVLPTPEEYQRFMANPAPNKREQLVDELLGRKEFAELWVMKWAELLQIRSSNQVSYKATLLYYNWLQDKIARNVPVNEWVQELLAASGGTFKNPATNYYQNEPDVLKLSENTAQVFLGMRIQCAQCHNHPFDRWTQDDYYSFAAFFSQIGRKGTDDPRETVVFNSGGGEVTHPVRGVAMKPKFLGGDVPGRGGQGPPRRAGGVAGVAEQSRISPTTSPTASGSNFFGIGIINEVDDVRVSNPASNPELLHELGKRFTDYKYDFKKLVRDICLSRTYQLSTQANESNAGDTRNFSHAPACAASRPRRSSTASARRRTRRTSSPACRWGAGGADRRRRRQHLLPDDVRPGDARDGLLVRSEVGADVVAVAAPAQRRHDDAEDPGRQPDRPAAGGGQDAAADRRGVVPALPEPQADGEGSGAAERADLRGAGQEEGAGRRLLGAAELARVHV